VAGILYDAVISSGTKKENVEIIYSEDRALEKALLDAQPGDFVVMFYENLKGRQRSWNGSAESFWRILIRPVR